jgi:peptidoglycan/LPS O-acetylase OafA/YrhL
MERSLQYRADIDGLRGIAVLSVLAYHLRVMIFRGGFVGVDIFFVISGYLISSVILQDIARGEFSFAVFYERRVRRILPALIVTLIGTSVLAYLYFLPLELVGFAKSLLSALFSSSNFYFWKQTSYFGGPVESMPLIHTWSLAVEEQFYLFLPVFLVLAHRIFPRKIRLVVLLIAAVSFVVSAVGAFRFPSASFYLPHTRAWELMLGVLISLDFFPAIAKPVLRNIIAFGGALLILVSVCLLYSGFPFPGVAALPPCLGTAMIIAAGRSGSSWPRRALSFKPLVFIGLISYSLYLWHWPVIVFEGMQSGLVSGLSVRMAKLVCIFVSLALATLSWKFVELPFRSGQKKLSRTALLTLVPSAAAIIIAIGITAIVYRGLPSRYPSGAVRVASYLEYDAGKYFRGGSCFISSEYKYSDFDTSKCLHTDADKKNYLLLGDSHAAHLWYGFSTTLDKVNILQATASGCKPTVEQPTFAAATCKHLMDYMFTDYLPSHHLDRVLIAARWQQEDLSPLSRTLDWARKNGISVVLFGPMVQYDTALPRLLAFSIRGHDPAIPDEHRVDQRQLDNSMARLASEKGDDYVSFYHSLCGPKSCAEFGVDGVPLQFDYGHLTAEGSELVAQKLYRSGELQ